jgi:di/tricarboxylate transporter
MATIDTDTSSSERQIAAPDLQKSNRRVPLLRRGIYVPIIIATTLIGLAIYAFHDLPGTQALRNNAMTTVAVAIFAATYLVIAVGKLPGFYLDRAGAALLGASLMVGSGVLSLDQAYRAIDFDTIALLLGMMIVAANLRLSGFFRLVNNWVVTRARHTPFCCWQRSSWSPARCRPSSSTTRSVWS